MSIFISITKFETGVWKACDLNDGNSIFYLQFFLLYMPLPVMYKQYNTLKQYTYIYIYVSTYHSLPPLASADTGIYPQPVPQYHARPNLQIHVVKWGGGIDVLRW